MDYPKDVMTKNNEVRILEETGSYVKYTYVDSKTGKQIKPGKYSLLLKNKDTTRHMFIVPLKDGRSMVVKDEIDNKKRKIWDKKNKKAIEL